MFGALEQMKMQYAHQTMELGKLPVSVARSVMLADDNKVQFDPSLFLVTQPATADRKTKTECCPDILQLDPVFRRFDPTIGELDPGICLVVPFIVQSDPLYGEPDPQDLQSDPLYGEPDPRDLRSDPFFLQLDPLRGELDPFIGQLDPIDGSIDPMAGTRRKPLKNPENSIL